VISINARTADGADPSWLWDVPFERLAARTVVATGDRCRDLSLRLHYAGVDHVMEPDPIGAVRLAAPADVGDGHDPDPDPGAYDDGGDDAVLVDVIGNYTAFGELLGARK
jgi:MurT ligase C-terminal